jgi:hypothetical protein
LLVRERKRFSRRFLASPPVVVFANPPKNLFDVPFRDLGAIYLSYLTSLDPPAYGDTDMYSVEQPFSYLDILKSTYTIYREIFQIEEGNVIKITEMDTTTKAGYKSLQVKILLE